MVEMAMEKRIPATERLLVWLERLSDVACVLSSTPLHVSVITYLQYSALRVAASVGENGMKLSEAERGGSEATG